MKIIYFDTRSLFYSKRHISSCPIIKSNFDDNLYTQPSLFLQNVAPDFDSVQLLSKAAKKAGFLLYPTGNRYTSTMLIEAGIFRLGELAPDVESLLSCHLDDEHPIRMLIEHASRVGAVDWFVTGDVACDLRDTPLESKLLEVKFGEGVTSELVQVIEAL